jgi:hypothetical protein
LCAFNAWGGSFSDMETLLYVVLAAILAGILIDASDRQLERTMRSRREPRADLRIVDDFDVKPVLRPKSRWRFRDRSAKTPPLPSNKPDSESHIA